MKAAILAGGLGTRLSEETNVRPKPMVEIGGRPILWLIMKIYNAHGLTDFIVCRGYKGYVIKEYFANYFLHMSDVTFDMRDNSMQVHQANAEPWKVTLVETGEETQIGGRIKRILPHIGDDEAFCVTYGDGVGDVDVRATIALHRKEKRLATVTATQPPGRFGAIRHEGTRVTGFRRSPSATAAGSMAGSSCSRRKSAATSTATARFGNANRWNASPRKASSAFTFTAAFGIPWTPCATAVTSKTSGRRARPPGRSGKPFACVS
jgi:glucose-1-phosphate cytidylyltransferase